MEKDGKCLSTDDGISCNINYIDEDGTSTTIDYKIYNNKVEEYNDRIANFRNELFGLDKIITLPIDFIKGLLENNTQETVVLPLPYLNNKTITLPPVKVLFGSNFNPLIDLLHLIINGVVGYYIIVQLFKMIKRI